MFGLPLEALAGRDADLADLLPRQEVEDLLERCAETPSPVRRIQVVTAWLGRRIQAGRALPLPIERAATELRRSRGRAPVGVLAQGGPWSRSRFSVRFREEVGVPPRTFARILRFHHAMAALESATGQGAGSLLSQVAHRAGFADQTHFTREFRSFAEMTPTQWLRRIRFPETTSTAEPR